MFNRSFFASVAAVLMLTAGQVQAVDTAQSVKLSVNGMVCAFCAQGIEKRLSAIPEAGPLYINLSQKVVAVQAKPGKALDVERLKAEVKEAGYEVTQAQTVNQSVAQIRAELKDAKK
jgi:periplasmic mercuric ion binding protein